MRDFKWFYCLEKWSKMIPRKNIKMLPINHSENAVNYRCTTGDERKSMRKKVNGRKKVRGNLLLMPFALSILIWLRECSLNGDDGGVGGGSGGNSDGSFNVQYEWATWQCDHWLRHYFIRIHDSFAAAIATATANSIH